MSIFKVHFIHCISIRNAADMACGPYLYFREFNQKYICSYHDMGNVDFNDINENDVVIIGASGLFEVSQEYVDNINLLLQKCKHVIAWSVGHNQHYGTELTSNIEYDKFSLMTVRDYNYKDELYLPCVTCMMPQLSDLYIIKRRIGVIEHTNHPIREFDYERLSNSCSLENIIHFIGESEIIITNSYHCVYWATLMEKKVILYNAFSVKFKFFKYPPTIYSGNLEEDIENAVIYRNVLEECRDLNIDYFYEVLEFIEKHKKPQGNMLNFNYEYHIRNCLKMLFNEQLKGKRLVIWGAGNHTKQLELLWSKNVNVVGITGGNKNYDFCHAFISLDDLDNLDFEVIIISSWILRKQMKEEIEKRRLGREVIDIYEYLEKNGIELYTDFYKYFSRTYLLEEKNNLLEKNDD